MAEVLIRDFREPDLEKVVEFKRRSAAISFPGKEPDMSRFRRQVAASMKSDPGSIKVAQLGRETAGYVYFTESRSFLGRYGKINHVFVDDAFRGKGVGTLLMKAAEDAMKARGITRIRATVTNTNEPSISLCRKLGYRETRVVMEKQL